jgi:hypothetical protein
MPQRSKRLPTSLAGATMFTWLKIAWLRWKARGFGSERINAVRQLARLGDPEAVEACLDADRPDR